MMVILLGERMFGACWYDGYFNCEPTGPNEQISIRVFQAIFGYKLDSLAKFDIFKYRLWYHCGYVRRKANFNYVPKHLGYRHPSFRQ